MYSFKSKSILKSMLLNNISHQIKLKPTVLISARFYGAYSLLVFILHFYFLSLPAALPL